MAVAGAVALVQRAVALPKAVHATVAQLPVSCHSDEVVRIKRPEEIPDKILECNSVTFPELQFQQWIPLPSH